MKLVNPKVEFLPQASGLEGVYKQIEFCARTCYKSEDKITKDSAKPFVDRMIKSNHLAMLEHGTIYLYYKECCYSKDDILFTNKYSINPYSKVVRIGCDDDIWPDGTYHDIMGGEATGNSEYVITTNLRALVENDWLDDLKYLCDPTKYHEKRYTFKLITDRGVSHELVRHRVFSFAQESQRYCNYSKDKYGSEITFIEPTWFKDAHNYIQEDFTEFLGRAEELYIYFSQLLKPQEARAILPNATKTEIVMTGFESDWKHFFDLRLYGKTGKPHPDMEYLAKLIYDKFVENGIIL